MSTSSKAFERLLKDGDYFNKKIQDLLKFEGNRKKTEELTAEFLCGFNDRYSDMAQAVESIKKVFVKIDRSFEVDSEDDIYSGVIFPDGTFGKSGKDYLYRLFDLFKIDHKIFLYCLDRNWKRVHEKLEEMRFRKKGEEIIDEFDLNNEESPLYVVWKYYGIAAQLNGGGKLDALTLKSRFFKDLKKKYPLHSKEIRRLFPDVAYYFEEATSPKKRKIDPTEDD